jgi:cysteinyl-tRNA synthetase
MQLYNTLTNKKEKFHPQEKGKVKMYTCGPTVYNYAHIGNLAAYLYADTLRRFLEFSGYEVRHIVNITDVGHLSADDVNQADSGEDKMLKAALREKKTPWEIAKFYTERFFEDRDRLNIKKAQSYPRATAHVDQMIKITETLVKKGLAYEKNGNVFFDVEKFDGYGKLSGKKLAELKHGVRLEDHPDKQHSYDFALWLKAPKNHLMQWDSPWSRGYPGWHIECSAMSMEYLGETLDIHTGGEDHVFPHHENEIAQSEGCTGTPFAHFWFHNRFLLVDGAKMSKSKGNFYVLADILEKGFDPMAFRMLILSSHYRSNVNFTWQSLEQAAKNLDKIARWQEKISALAGPKKIQADGQASDKNAKMNSPLVQEAHTKIQAALEDDLNTPLALSELYELISQSNRQIDAGESGQANARELLKFWDKINQVFGLILPSATEKLPEEIEKLARKRQTAREQKDFKLADELRDQIEARGFQVEDTPEGQKIRSK